MGAMKNNVKRVSGWFVVQRADRRQGATETFRVEDNFEAGYPAASMLAVLELQLDTKLRGYAFAIVDSGLDVVA